MTGTCVCRSSEQQKRTLPSSRLCHCKRLIWTFWTPWWANVRMHEHPSSLSNSGSHGSASLGQVVSTSQLTHDVHRIRFALARSRCPLSSAVVGSSGECCCRVQTCGSWCGDVWGRMLRHCAALVCMEGLFLQSWDVILTGSTRLQLSG